MHAEAKERLRDAVRWAEQENEKPDGHWYQSMTYLPEEERVEVHGEGCGSAYCIAGRVVAAHYGVEDPYKAIGGSVLDHATVLLGLSPGEASELFNGGNSIETVQEIAARLLKDS